MIYVSLLVEILRSRPRLVFWMAMLAQVTLWTLVPALFYSAPPGDVAEVLARGHGFGFEHGPPLAYWLAEIAFILAGDNIVGVYVLSQICIVVTYWAVFTLGRATLGDRHAALAVLLMVGISAFTVPTLDFGPAILVMPLWALALLHLWRAVGEERRIYWYAVALDLGLLLLTSYVGLVLAIVVLVFVLVSERGQTQLAYPETWAAGIIVAFMMFPSLIWLEQESAGFLPKLAQLRSAQAVNQNLIAWTKLWVILLVGHAGTGILVAIASNLARRRRAQAAIIERAPVDPAARSFIYYFALAPALAVTPFIVITDPSGTLNAGPLVILSGLAIVLAAGDRIMLHHQHIIGITWFGLLLVPPVLTAAAVVILPRSIGFDLKITQPAADIGRFFAESFQRRTGKPLAIVAGDPQLAYLIALSAASRPKVLTDEAPEGPKPVSSKDIAEQGAIVVWPVSDQSGEAPPEIKARYPNLVPELPRAFERRFQARLPVLRIGWAVIRPQSAGQ